MNTETLANFLNLIIEPIVEKNRGRGFGGWFLFLPSFICFFFSIQE